MYLVIVIQYYYFSYRRTELYSPKNYFVMLIRMCIIKELIKKAIIVAITFINKHFTMQLRILPLNFFINDIFALSFSDVHSCPWIFANKFM